MKQISAAFIAFSQPDIRSIELNGGKSIVFGDETVELTMEDVEIVTEDIPGWLVATQDHLTVALDMTLTPELVQEGLAREVVNRVQNMRKDAGFEVTDTIVLQIESHINLDQALLAHKDYICSETLAVLEIIEHLEGTDVTENEITESLTVRIRIRKS
jgi:isoleucyl-tRNA synthetase